MNIRDFNNEEDWLAERRKGIGASEVSGILGQSRFSSPYSVWYSKVGRVFQTVDKGLDPMREWGHRHERAIGEAFMDKVDRETLPCGPNADYELHDMGDYAMCWSESPDWMFSTLDRVLRVDSKPVAVVEFKCAWWDAVDEWQERIPIGYQCQIQAQLHCTGLDVGYFAVLLNGYDFRWYRAERHQSFIDRMMRRCGELWERVRTETPPPVDHMDATSDAIKARYRECDGSRVDLPPESSDWYERLKKAKEKEAEASRSRKMIENRIKQEIGDAEIGVLPDGKSAFSWKPRKDGVRVFKETTAK